MTMKYTVAAVVIAIALPQAAFSQTKQPVDVGGYCEVVEKQIVALANTASTANGDLAKFASDQPAADPAKFASAAALLNNVTESLKDKEVEWYHLGCMQIIYHPSRSN